ncbi:myosin-1 [Micropterus dolomieu]|uniref:myosin-1 n=1 Tax=Micropterus dolomieu TaxID=147949 RepID=UPI001E8E3967|nr:myosin-1 [Micropterus dolomieu]
MKQNTKKTLLMQQIYRQTDQQFEVFTTVISPQVCRSRTRTTRVDAQKVVVAVTQYRSRWPKELDLNQGDLIQVLCKEDDSWWFGRLTDGNEGYFPAACVEPLQGGDSSRATPTPLRRGSVPVPVTTAGAPCGCTSGRSTPKLLRKNSIRRPLGLDGPSAAPPHGSPSLLHRVLAKSRRKSCPLLPHAPLDTGSDNSAFQAD